jgi:acetoin utilization deacetylase AcuC-like enzyme
MKIITHSAFAGHDTGGHPENPQRLRHFKNLPDTVIPFDERALELVHDAEMIIKVREACKHSLTLDPDTVTSPESYRAAVFAANAAILASRQNDFALVRPPGHHAYRNHSAGFCLFNNIAIAAQSAVNEGKRVAIIDIDGHYGDGTADIFYRTNKVQYCSMHQYPAYPGNGSANETGEGEGKGYTVNFPLAPGSGDDVFIDSVKRAIEATKQFKPDLVGISAGFDACIHDPLLQLDVTIGCFHGVGALLGKSFENLFAVLEGGYDLDALPMCIENFIAGINGEGLGIRG